MRSSRILWMLISGYLAGSNMLAAQAISDSIKKYSYPEHGFAAAFPKKPVKTKAKYTYDSTAINTAYTLVDSKEGIYYQCLVQDMAKGYFLSADSAVFDSYKSNLVSGESATIVSERRGTFQQYPALWMDVRMEKEGEEHYTRVLSVHRGNRLYFLFAIIPGTEPNETVMNKFIESFQLIPVKENSWKQQEPGKGRLGVWSPAPMQLDTVYDTGNSIYTLDELYRAYDSTTPGTFYIEKLQYDPYYWAESDTALLRTETNNALDATDSLLEYKTHRQGRYSIADLLVRISDNHNRKKIRFILNGNTLYKLFTILPNEWMQANDCRHFFTSFAPREDTATDHLFSSKAKKLLNALQTTDSACFAQARLMLEKVVFTKNDIPYLHEALLKRRIDDSSYYSSATAILSDIVSDISDERTPGFVSTNYTAATPYSISLRYELLRILARQKTTAAYTTINELLKTNLPAGENGYRFYSCLYDSLALSAPLLPALQPLLKDTVAATAILELTETLIDSGLVKKDFLNTSKTAIYAMADQVLQRIGQNSELENAYKYDVVVRMLTKINTPAAFNYLQRFATEKNIDLKYTAVCSLVKLNKPVNPLHLQQVAESNVYRTSLYHYLKKEKKLGLFPKLYFTQKALAESDLYNYILDEAELEVKHLDFLSELVTYYQGKKRKFYLFKADMSDGEEKNIRLGIAGPYHMNQATVLVTYPAALGIYWEEEFNKKKTESMFRAYLKQLEEQQEDAVEAGLQ
jgi:hypothetical protein